MARVTLGTLHCGDMYSRKWNKQWEENWRLFAGTLFGHNTDHIPQDLFDEVLAHAFWATAATAKYPKDVEAPPRPKTTQAELFTQIAKFVAGVYASP
jgi:hypothetical protein